MHRIVSIPPPTIDVRPTKRQCVVKMSLTDFPLETLTEILFKVPWRGLNAITRVCSRIREVMREHRLLIEMIHSTTYTVPCSHGSMTWHQLPNARKVGAFTFTWRFEKASDVLHVHVKYDFGGKPYSWRVDRKDAGQLSGLWKSSCVYRDMTKDGITIVEFQIKKGEVKQVCETRLHFWPDGPPLLKLTQKGTVIHTAVMRTHGATVTPAGRIPMLVRTDVHPTQKTADSWYVEYMKASNRQWMTGEPLDLSLRGALTTEEYAALTRHATAYKLW